MRAPLLSVLALTLIPQLTSAQTPVPLDQVAKVDVLLVEADDRIAELEKLFTSEEAYEKGGELAIPSAAGVLACIGQGLALHKDSPKDVNATGLSDAALAVAEAGDLDEAKAAVDLKKKDLKAKKEELEKIIADTEKEEASLTKKGDKAIKAVDERLLKAYNRIRHTYRNGLAVVTIERDSCGGCFSKVPPQRKLELRQRKKIIVCEHCGRILVDQGIAGLEEEA